MCPYKTSRKYYLGNHIKSKHKIILQETTKRVESGILPSQKNVRHNKNSEKNKPVETKCEQPTMSNSFSEGVKDNWECSICNIQVNFESRESHLATCHNMTVTEYIKIQNISQAHTEISKRLPKKEESSLEVEETTTLLMEVENEEKSNGDLILETLNRTNDHNMSKFQFDNEQICPTSTEPVHEDLCNNDEIIPAFKCTLFENGNMCTYVAEHKQSLNNHMEVCHQEYAMVNKHGNNLREFRKAPQYKCPMCPLKTTDKSGYDKHLLNVHELVEIINDKSEELDMSVTVSEDSGIWETELGEAKIKESAAHSYNCAKCDFSTSWRQHLQDHESRIHERITFECDICGKRANRKGAIYDHKRRMHEGVKRYRCSLCDWSSYEKKAMVTHIMDSHPGLNDQYKIKAAIVKIDWRASSKNTIKKIEPMNRASTPIKSEVIKRIETTDGLAFRCDICGKKASRKSSIDDHKRRVHEGVKRFKCSICEWANYERTVLKWHVRKSHPEIKDSDVDGTIVNINWGSTTPKTEKLVQVTETNTGLLHCTKCDFTTRNGRTHLRDHERRKHEGVVFECDICGKRSARKGNILDHKRRMHEGVKRFKCSVCDWANYEKNALVRHITEHHTELNEKSKVEEAIVKVDWRSLNLNTNESKISDPLLIKCSNNANERPLTLTKDSLWDCKICKKQMRFRSQKSHLKTYHNMTLAEFQNIQYLNDIESAEEKIKCEHCTFKASELVLQHHMTLNHKVEKVFNFKCHECRFTSQSEHEMVQHWRKLHDSKKQFNGKNEKTVGANSQVQSKDEVTLKNEEQDGTSDNQDTSLDMETNAEITEFLSPSN